MFHAQTLPNHKAQKSDDYEQFSMCGVIMCLSMCASHSVLPVCVCVCVHQVYGKGVAMKVGGIVEARRPGRDK